MSSIPVPCKIKNPLQAPLLPKVGKRKQMDAQEELEKRNRAAFCLALSSPLFLEGYTCHRKTPASQGRPPPTWFLAVTQQLAPNPA